MAVLDYNSERLEAEAVENYKEYLKRKKLINKYPVMSRLKLESLGVPLQKYNARQSAYKANLEGGENIKQIIPFIGMGSKGQKELDKLLTKEGAFTNHGEEREKQKAIKSYNLSRKMEKVINNNQAQATLYFAQPLPISLELQARQQAYSSDLRGINRLQTLLPIAGMGNKGKKSLKNILEEEKTAAYKELESTKRNKGKLDLYPYGAVLLPAAGSMISSNSIQMDLAKDDKLNSNQIEERVKANDKIKDYFKKRGVTSKVDDSTKNNVLGSNFNPITNKVVSNKKTPEIVAHELGHADNLRQYKKVFGETGGKAFQIMNLPIYPMGPSYLRISKSGLLAAPLFFDKATNKLKSNDKDSKRNKVISTIQKYPEIPGVLSVAPLLGEEASASFKALKSLKEVAPEQIGRASKRLGKAFGTYGAFAMVPIAASHIYGRDKRRKIKSNA